jgi:hypothetical protein
VAPKRSYVASLLPAAIALLAAAAGCSSDEDDGSTASSDLVEREGLVVNGKPLNPTEARWMRYVAANVVPRLGGSREQQLTTSARVAWWSLKEGVLGIDNALAYSNCNTPAGDRHVGPLDGCGAGRAWQVGLSGVQVPGRDLGALEKLATELYPGASPDEVLAQTASDGGVDPAAVQRTSGSIRASWFLRNAAIGFTMQAPTITAECINGSRSWCYGSGWPTSRSFAPDRGSAMKAIEDIKSVLSRLEGPAAAPPPAAPPFVSGPRPTGGPFEALLVKVPISARQWLTQCNESADGERVWESTEIGPEALSRWAESKYPQLISGECGTASDGVFPIVLRSLSGNEFDGWITQCESEGKAERVFQSEGAQVDGHPAVTYRYVQPNDDCP